MFEKIKNIFSFKKTEPKSNFNPYWSADNLVPFDGEKTPYELGTPISYYIDYYATRIRSWEAYLKSDILQNAIKKYLLWIVGPGLKLQSNPVLEVLKNEKIEFDNKTISLIEAYFRLYADDKSCSYTKEYNLHDLSSEALKNAIISGDVLCVQRVENKRVTIDIIDGYFVQTPLDDKIKDAVENRGNRIDYGVEINKRGQHVAYYILQENNTYKRILAEKNGQKFAWLFYGLRYKKNTTRGMSLLTVLIETAKKMDRYKDATLDTAEENNKIPYTINHNQFSTGENPLTKQLVQSMGKGKGIAPETDSFEACEQVATKIAVSTNKQTYNMPIGSQLSRNDFKSDNQFENFFSVNADIVYSTFGIPPEVAADKFGGSYSSSRASLKSWEYKMVTDRINLVTNQFYKPFYVLWLDIQILTNKISIPGYLEAYNTKNLMTLLAFRNCRFIGATVPHIDPYKEVNAERLKLGETFKNVPLTTAEQSCERLNSGDFEAVVKKATVEKDLAEEFTETEVETEIQIQE